MAWHSSGATASREREPFSAVAVADEAAWRCAAPLSTFLEDAAHGFRWQKFVVKMSWYDVQLTGLDRADYSRNSTDFCEAEKAKGLKYGGSSCRASRWS
jgi:hypothetical protein